MRWWFRSRIIAHEYGHGISTRMVGGRVRFDCLISQGTWRANGRRMVWLFWTYNDRKKQRILSTTKRNRNLCTISRYGWTWYTSCLILLIWQSMAILRWYRWRWIKRTSRCCFVWCTIIWDMYWAFIAQDGYDPDIYHGTGGNNMATISNGWFWN
jgi:hypothetical protein